MEPLSWLLKTKQCVQGEKQIACYIVQYWSMRRMYPLPLRHQSIQSFHQRFLLHYLTTQVKQLSSHSRPQRKQNTLQGVKLTATKSQFATNRSTKETFSMVLCRSRLVGLVCSVCTEPDLMLMPIFLVFSRIFTNT